MRNETTTPIEEEEEEHQSVAANNDDDNDDEAKNKEKSAEASTAEEMMLIYASLNEEDEDGLDFIGSTSQAIAYERDLESQRTSSTTNDDNDDNNDNQTSSLFHDHLAKHFIGTKGQKCSQMINMHLDSAFKLNVGTNFHIGYTAARTKLINDKLETWISNRNDGNNNRGTKKRMQVVNLGAGVDTRPYWLECLQNVDQYIEVDTKNVNDFKQRKLNEIKNDKSSIIKTSYCNREIINLDFNKESIKDVFLQQDNNNSFDSTVPTCWILEGLVMYLTKDTVIQLLKNITDLSVNGSYLMINFFNGPDDQTASSISYMSELLLSTTNNKTSPSSSSSNDSCYWSNEQLLSFGEKDFHYNRFPKSMKEPKKAMGFAFYDYECNNNEE